MITEQRIMKYKHWSQLSEEQLAFVLSQELSDEGKVKIFLYLSGLEIETEDIVPSFKGEENMSMEEYGEWLDTIEGLLNGSKVCLRESVNGQRSTDNGQRTTVERREWRESRSGRFGNGGRGQGGYYYADVADLAYASMEELRWMEDDKSLIALPMEKMKIGKHEYKMPDALMINTKYQQYSNAQGYMVEYWRLIGRVTPPREAEEGQRTTDSGQRSKGKKKGGWKKPSEEELMEIARQMVKVRNGFMASMLVPYRWKVKARWPFFFKEPYWDAESEEEIMRDMAHAPMWLFDALYKQWQDNIMHFRKKFPEMFTEAKEDPKHDAFVAELGTINLVIEKGGYGNASAVYDENCVFIFKLLNDVIKENKEIEKMNKEAKLKK